MKFPDFHASAALQKERPSDYVFADWLSAGDISSLRWFDSPLKTGHHNGLLGSKMVHQVETETCSVYYAGLNQRDIMLANGSIQRDLLPNETFYNEGILGIEFSGRNSSGQRVMGLCPPPVSSVSSPISFEAILCSIYGSGVLKTDFQSSKFLNGEDDTNVSKAE